jgi:hypothetical protein
MDERTVLDVLEMVAAAQLLKHCDVDPGMPFDQFTRWLRYGQKADEIKPLSGYHDDIKKGWDACRDAIRGGG